METRNFLDGKNKISLLGFGCMRLPKLFKDKEDIDTAAAERLIDYAVSKGVNYFDTAWVYHGGTSESFIGGALKKYSRDSFYLADKLPNWLIKQPGDVDTYFDAQLSRCGVEYFDFYLVHALNQRGYQKMIENKVYENLLEKKREGKIKYLGFSFHDHPSLIKKIVEGRQWDFAQIQLNYLDWLDYGSKTMYSYLTKKGIPVVVMEPVRGGALATLCPSAAAVLKAYNPSASLASWALRYVGSLKNVLTVLSGMSEYSQVEDNLNTFEKFKPLTKKEREVLDEAIKEYRKYKTIKCTKCGYCTDCGKGVDIPQIFDIFNQYCLTGEAEKFIKSYDALPDNKKASLCTACGACALRCPQGLDIPELLKTVAKKAANIGF